MVSFLCFTYGLFVGSFLNVCIYRIPQKQSVVFRASHCIHCHQNIKYYDLLPIISYLLLKGRCRHCQKPIPKRYPFVELLNAILYVLTFQVYGITEMTFVLCGFFSVLVVLTFVDIDHLCVPDNLNVLIAAFALIAILFSYKTIPEHLLGSIIIALPMFFIAHLTKGFGIGDVFLYATAGLLLGYKLTLLSFVIACTSAALVGLYLILCKGLSRKAEIPFVPFIAFGLFVSALYSDWILIWYVSFFRL